MVPGIRRTKLGVAPMIKDNGNGLVRDRFLNEEEDSKALDHFKFLQQQVKTLSIRAEALETEKRNANHNNVIWQRRVEEEAQNVKERDMAITKMLDENRKTRNDLERERESYSKLYRKHEDLKRLTEQECDKTAKWHDSSMVVQTGKIEELQRQVHHLKSCNAQLSSAHLNQEQNLKEVIKGLNHELKAKEKEDTGALSTIQRLEKQCEEAKASQANASNLRLKVERLIAENEGLTTDNHAQATELRDLKRQLRKAKSSSREILELQQALAASNTQILFLEQDKARVVESVRKELKAAEDTHRQLERVFLEMEAQGMSITAGMKSNDKCEESIDDVEKEVGALKSEIRSESPLSKEIEIKSPQDSSPAVSETMKALETSEYTNQLVESHGALLQYSGSKIQKLQQALSYTEKAFNTLKETSASEKKLLEEKLRSTEKLIDAKSIQISFLEDQLASAKARMDQTTNGLSNEMTTALNDATKAREASEKAIVRTYDTRLAEKDASIWELREDLVATRNKRAEEVSELNKELGTLRSKLAGIHEDYDQQNRNKEQHIHALEHALHSQEQTLDSMRTEMDQLQQSMQNTATKRRGEVEELQVEVIALRTEKSRRDKEIISLQMQLNENELQRKHEVLKLKETVSELEGELPLIKKIASIESDQRIFMVRERLDQLKNRNAELKEENRRLGERLEKNIIKLHSLENEASDAKDAMIECDILREQVAELHDTLEKFHVPGYGSARKETSEDDPNRRSSRTRSTPIRLFLGRGKSSSTTRTAAIEDEACPSSVSRPEISTVRQGQRVFL